MKLLKNIFLLLGLIFIFSCEDVIDVDANFQEPQLVIDAWVNNNNSDQTIRITWSQNYFDSIFAQAVTGAEVTITKNGTDQYIFEDNGDGNYIWSPTGGSDNLGEIDDQYKLDIKYENEVFQATTSLSRTAIIDSLQIFEKTEEELGYDIGFYGALYARDHVGFGDAYWIKAYTNDTLHNKPFELSLSYDGTFDPGSIFDGQGFIRPIRESVNRISEDNTLVPLKKGDVLRAEVHSISDEAFTYLGIIQEQINNGENSIFALPLANADGNIINLTQNRTALGFFNVAEIVEIEEVVE